MNSDLCILPFIGLYIRADGNIYPCESVAWQNERYFLGNIETHTLEEAWNALPIRKLRQKIIKTGTCELSSEQKNSCMYLINKNLYKDTFETFVTKIDKDGNYPFELQVLFLERSNLCNLRCLYCNEISSSVWEKDSGYTVKKVADEIYDEKLSPYLVNLKELFLSGGEPVLHPYNFKILKFLKIVNPKIQLGMATNLTYNLNKYKDFFDLFCSFNDSKIFCSIDVDGEKFEIIRHNSKWSVVENNIKELKKYKLKIYLNSVISILNVPYLKEFHNKLIQDNIIGIDGIRYLTLQGPDCMCIQNLPDNKKQEYSLMLVNYIAFLRAYEKKLDYIDLFPNNKTPSTAIELVRQFMSKPSLVKQPFDYKTQLFGYIPKETLERLFSHAL